MTIKQIVIGADSFGNPLREALIPVFKDKGYEVIDIGKCGKYYEVAIDVAEKVANSGDKARGVLLCGTGMGVSMIANKVPGIRAAVVENAEAAANSRSVNCSNVLTLGAMITDPEAAKVIVDAWLSTEFKGPSPANKGQGWNEDIQSFLTQSLPDISKLEHEQVQKAAYQVPCPICVMTSPESYKPVEGIEGASWIEVRKNPTRAFVKFPAGAIEPAHHHTHGHDVFVVSGSKTVENTTLGQSFDLSEGSYLYTAGGQVHRVRYHEDTEFIICSDGQFDVFWDEPWPDDASSKA